MGPKDKSGTGFGKPCTETRPCPTEMGVVPAAVKVEIENMPDPEVDMILPAVPEPDVKKVSGANLSLKEQDRKNKLIRDIFTAREHIREWTKREKEAKDELKRLEIKEQRLREKALQEDLRGERPERRKMEVEMRKLKGQVDQKKSVFEEIDLFKYEELVLGEGFHLEELILEVYSKLGNYVYFTLIWHCLLNWFQFSFLVNFIQLIHLLFHITF